MLKLFSSDTTQTIYYTIGSIAFGLASIRFFYGWFRDYDNATRFTKAMAKTHLPYIYNMLDLICKNLGIETERPPDITFVDDDKVDTRR